MAQVKPEDFFYLVYERDKEGNFEFVTGTPEEEQAQKELVSLGEHGVIRVLRTVGWITSNKRIEAEKDI